MFRLRANPLSRRMKHTLPDLPYDYNALEPFISAEIMQLHHSKHHQTYVTNLNVFEEKMDSALTQKNVKEQIALQSALKFNGGGHINHTQFWTNLAPVKNGGGTLHSKIEADFGGLDKFKATFAAQAAAVQGSGWGWLGYNTASKKLEIATTANQDPLLSIVPLLAVDVWEVILKFTKHAYYLQYKNVRPDYLKAIWSVVNWKNVEERLKAATAKA